MMTHKEELAELARSLVLKINQIQPEQWDSTDQRDCELLRSALQRVEREVWKKAAAYYEKVMMLYGNDSWRERNTLQDCADWCREQAKEVE